MKRHSRWVRIQSSQSTAARKLPFPEPFQIDLGSPVPHSKNIPLNPSGKSKLKSAASHPSEGRFAIVTDAGWDAVDATASGASRVRRAASHRERTTARKMNDARSVRQNRVVSTPVAGAKLSVTNSIQPDRSVSKPAVTEARRIRLRRERGISRKTIAQGMPECSDCTCMLVCVFCALFAHETAGAACTRHSLLPL